MARGLSIFWLRKNGFLDGRNRYGGIKWTSRWGSDSNINFELEIGVCPRIRFLYEQTYDEGHVEHFDYSVDLTTTECHYGGERFWFICPLYMNGRACGKRVGVLYLAGKYLGCRSCYDLAYNSQQDSVRYRALSKFLGFTQKVDEEEQELRVKYWKGRPTKRYAKFLRKVESMISLSHIVMAEFEERPSKKKSTNNQTDDV